MKKIVLLLALLAAGTGVSAQQGMVFDSLPFKKALAEAGKTGKLVFMDCYTEWCGPCKAMAANVFPRTEVGEYMNARFVNIKVDMEKGEGPLLSKQYGVAAYPTFLILKPDGSVVHKFVGGSDAQAFLKKVEESFDANKSYESIKARYDSGDRTAGFLFPCLVAFMSMRDPQTGEVLDALMKTLPDRDKTAPEYWFIYGNSELTPMGSANERFLFDNFAAFRRNVGKEKVDKALSERYKAQLMAVIEAKNTAITQAELGKMIRDVAALQLDNQAIFDVLGRLAVTVRDGDMNRIVPMYVKELSAMKPSESYMLYIGMTDRVLAQGTPGQKKAWVSLAETINGKMDDAGREKFAFIVKYIKEKAAL